MKADSVKCGFNKWSIGLDENAAVVVEFSYHPNYGTISLHDVSIPELRSLGEMFLSAVREYEKAAAEKRNV